MCAQTAAEQDRSASLIKPAMAWRVAEVRALPAYRLWVRFRDGLEGEVDMAALVHSPEAGLFGGLADPTRFGLARVELGVVTWPDGLDLAPDAMYRSIKASGKWILS
jgi:hypothetical protein